MSHQAIKWNASWQVHKFNDPEALRAAGLNPEKVTWAELEDKMSKGLLVPSDVMDREGNLLVTEGIGLIWEALTGGGTATAGQDLSFLSNGNAYIGVGNGTAVAAIGQTDLQGASKLFVGMEATYPQISSPSVTFRSVFGSGQAEFAWEEWAVANNSAPGTTGRILNRKVEALGTKGAGSTWTFTVTISLS